MEEVEMVTITKEEYYRLLNRDDWLGWLEAAGVDSWEGYDVAQDMRGESEEEDN